MLDLSWTEMAVIVVVVLLVVGPKDLPKVVRGIRHWLGKARGMVRELQSGMDEMVREAELQELRQDIDKTAKDSLGGLDDLTDPTGGDLDIEKEGDEALDALASQTIEPRKPATETESKPDGGASAPSDSDDAPDTARAAGNS